VGQRSVGIVGLGVILGAYLETLRDHPDIRIAAVADLHPDRAREIAAGIPGCRALTVDELMVDDGIETVLNLTIPAAHADIALRAIAAGKDVYGEKPLAATLEDARFVVAAAADAQVGLGCAPDTVLGTGTQTARLAVESGLIGRPTGASAVFIAPGHEAWHPHPDFYYRQGGGPLLDMGPYYVSSLVHILGPVVSVIGASGRTRDERVIASGERAGERIPVEVDTHVAAVLVHSDGAVTTLTTSFDGARTQAPPIEIHGERGTLAVPDPNTFGGDVLLAEPGIDGWRTLEPTAGFVDGARGAGLIDFASRGRDGVRASGAIALHVLEVMSAILRSSKTGQAVPILSRPSLPELVPLTPAQTWRGIR